MGAMKQIYEENEEVRGVYDYVCQIYDHADKRKCKRFYHGTKLKTYLDVEFEILLDGHTVVAAIDLQTYDGYDFRNIIGRNYELEVLDCFLRFAGETHEYKAL